MYKKQILILLSVGLISISTSSLFASDNNNTLINQEKKLETGTPADSSEKIPSLDLTIDPDIIKEQQETTTQNADSILPNLFKDKKNNGDVSMEGGTLMKNGSNKYAAPDGAEISVKVKTE